MWLDRPIKSGGASAVEGQGFSKCVDLPFFLDPARLPWMNHSYINETRIMNMTVIEQSEQQAVLQRALHCAYYVLAITLI